ncbi:MAG: hypothetical protein IJR50_00875 [Treponema sp.]|nr:hypothetical protein [Treponema sp.]
MQKNIKIWMRHIVVLDILFVCLISSCSKRAAQAVPNHAASLPDTVSQHSDELHADNDAQHSGNTLTLPQKQNARSMLMSESPITPRNIDSYLFLDDCIYVDVRSVKMFYEEGHIAGFINIPFYGYIADFPNSHNALFEMTRQDGAYLGDVGSFSENYEDAANVIYNMLDKNKAIIAISTAGVESCYFLNLLVQLGYDGARLYNAGSFTNGMGNDIAYRTYRNARHLVRGIELPATKITYTIDSLEKIKK